jgi:hypothetical protein
MPRKRKQQPFKRQYATHYFSGQRDRFPAAVSHGACASEEGAIRASAVRIFLGQYQKCQVVDRANGVTLYTVRTGAGGIHVEYGSGVSFKTYRAA